MSEKGSVFQKGGGGTNFEQNVQTAFLVTMLVGGDVPCLLSSRVIELALQVTNRGYETDDLLVVAKSEDGEHRMLIQVKHEIAFTAKNKLCKEVFSAFWKDYNNASVFNKEKDKLVVVKSGLTNNERNHLKSILNWANTHSTATDFVSEVNRIKAKKEQLDVFRSILKEANNNVELTDEALWEFLKCVDVLEYDFLNEGSTSKTNFLNLIKLCKNSTSALNEEDIWNSLYSYVSSINPNGGSVTLESVKEQDFYKHFNLTLISPSSAAVKKLQNDSQTILRPIKTTIGFGEREIHFQRTELIERISDSINNSQITIVLGKPGVGKTAVVKDLLKKDFPNASVIVFRADQFSVPTLANVLSNIGINEPIDDIFSCVSLIPEKIVFVDSFEKLLESDPECAFRQFLTLIKDYPDVKVVLATRKYALDLLSLKFDIGCNSQQIIEIPQLDESELLIASQKYPNLNLLFENEKIKQLLQCPKYLDFALRAIDKAKNDLSNLTVSGFKDMLWNALVVDAKNTKNGLSIKREKAFMNIAVKRAKEMKLFTKPDEAIDADALVCLENDEIVFQENTNRKYSPTHDILEDWALERYVSEKYDECSNPEDFFVNLGNEPAIRRAFRLWVEDYLIDNNDKLVELIRVSLSDNTIERYWADELMISVFRSDNCAYFFEAFEKDLLLDNGAFLNKCLHVIKTCCKEMVVIGDNIFIPIGGGWECALSFIRNHVEQLNEIRMSIISFMVDWYNKLLLKYDHVGIEEQSAAKSIVLYYIGEIENGSLELDNNEFYEKSLISILLDLVAVSKDEIVSLVKRCYDHKKNEHSWKLHSFYEKVKERVLSGVGNVHFVDELPELVIEVAWKEWKYTPIEEDYPDDHALYLPHQLHEDERWGIKCAQYFPSGIYKTPFYNLLKYHFKEGLAFIVGFINYAVDFYVNATNIQYKFDITKVDVVIDDQTVSSKHACAELWMAYRAHSVTSYLLESLLMSLEKYLLEIARIGSEVSRGILNYIFNYILKNSNNVAPVAVLSSVTMAYPKEVGAAMLPLFSVKEFYDWDLNRALHEHASMAIYDHRIPFAQKERWESNQLPHRTKYYRGLLGFVLYYQFNIRTLNEELFKIFDVLKQKSQGTGDVIWEKNLLEMDIRNHEIGEYNPKLGGYLVTPKYNEEVNDFIKDNQDEYDCYQESSKFASLMQKAWENNDVISFEDWMECYSYYSKKDKEDVPLEMKLLDRPITLAYLGLSCFSKNISADQKEWCIDRLYQSIIDIIQEANCRGFDVQIRYNIIEKDIALSSFHLLMDNVTEEDEKNSIALLIIYVLIAPFANSDFIKNALYFRGPFFDHYPSIAKKIWLVFISLSVYRKRIGYNYRCESESQLQKEDDFIYSQLTNKGLSLDLQEIAFDKCDRFILYKAFVSTPIHFEDSDFYNFISHTLSIIIGDLQREEENSVLIQVNYELTANIEQYLALCLLDSESCYSSPLFKKLVETALSHKQIIRYGRNELLEFVDYVLDFLVIKLYDKGALYETEDIYKKEIEHFWYLWNVFDELIPEDSKHPLVQKLLFDIQYLLADDKGILNEDNWKVLENKKEFYRRILMGKGKHYVASAIKVFSTIGNKTFMPDGISWISDLLKNDSTLCGCLNSTQAEKWIKRLFYDHISSIKSNKRLIEVYLWILNKMVELGSSNAYFIRENVITYKKVC